MTTEQKEQQREKDSTTYEAELNLFVRTPDGYEGHVKVTNVPATKVFSVMETVIAGAKAKGYMPSERGKGHAPAPAASASGEAVLIPGEDGKPPRCSIHGPMEWKEGFSQKTGKDYAFWACKSRGCKPKEQK